MGLGIRIRSWASCIEGSDMTNPLANPLEVRPATGSEPTVENFGAWSFADRFRANCCVSYSNRSSRPVRGKPSIRVDHFSPRWMVGVVVRVPVVINSPAASGG